MRQDIKILLIACLNLGIIISSKSQIMVLDQKLIESIVANHLVTMSQLSPIQNNLHEVAEVRKRITEKIVVIQLLKQKMYDGIHIVADIIRDGKNVRHAYKIVLDIGQYQKEMVNYAQANPALLLVAFQTEAALISRSADLLTVIYDNAIKGGNDNLMSGKQRMQLIRLVIHELRLIRGIAYGVVRKMRIATRTGILKSLNPFHINYPDQDEFLVDKILEGF